MGVTRRQFLGASAAAVVAAGTMAKGKVFGANDKIGVCCVGVHGRGGNHVRNFGKGTESEVVALCDVDAHVLEERASDVEKATGKRPKLYRDMREAFTDPSVDVVSIATPNHWHTLAAIWAIKDGKDVYVEKPLSHNVWEGRQLADLTKKSDRIVQHGTQNRCIPTFGWAMDQMRQGLIGEVYMARALCFKQRDSIGDGEVTAPPDFLDYDLWQGPRPVQPYRRRVPGTGKPDRHAVEDGVGGLYIHYNWHWFWAYGNGDIGNQGVHQMDVAIWGMGKGLPTQVYSAGGRYGEKDHGETPNTLGTTFRYADGTVLEFAVRGLATNGEGPTIGNLFYGSNGWCSMDAGGGIEFHTNDGQSIKPHDFTEQMPTADEPDVQYWKFLKTVRNRKKEDIQGNAEEGHLSSAACHLANIAYRVGRSLEFDPETERFVGDNEANKLLKDEYRPGFEVPETV